VTGVVVTVPDADTDSQLDRAWHRHAHVGLRWRGIARPDRPRLHPRQCVRRAGRSVARCRGAAARAT